MKKLLMAALVPTLVAGCSESTKQQISSSGEALRQLMQINANQITIKTTDDQAIAGAQVLIGDALNSPFQGNLLTTNAAGQVVLPAGWNQALPVTIAAPGFVRVTYMNVEPGSMTVKLRKMNVLNQYEVKGTAQGLPIKNGDDKIDFGLVMPAFSKMQLFTFNMDSVISSQYDTISAVGQQIQVPVNLSIPKQTEKYLFINVTLDKPAYRVYFGQPGVQRLFAAKGSLPFKSTVDSLRDGKQFWELINSIKLSGGALRDLNITNGQTSLDMPTGELSFNEAKNATAPQFRADESFMAVAITNQSGYLFPTDVKKLNPGQSTALNTLPGTPSNILGVLKRSEDWTSGEDRVSTTMMPFANGAAPQVLPLIGSPTVTDGGRSLAFPQINPITGVNPIGTLSVLSVEMEAQQGPNKVKMMNAAWEIYSAKWVTNLKVPAFPGDNFGNGKKRWEVNFLGSQTTSQADLGPAMIESATHATHSSTTF